MENGPYFADGARVIRIPRTARAIDRPARPTLLGRAKWYARGPLCASEDRELAGTLRPDQAPRGARHQSDHIDSIAGRRLPATLAVLGRDKAEIVDAERPASAQPKAGRRGGGARLLAFDDAGVRRRRPRACTGLEGVAYSEGRLDDIPLRLLLTTPTVDYGIARFLWMRRIQPKWPSSAPHPRTALRRRRAGRTRDRRNAWRPRPCTPVTNNRSTRPKAKRIMGRLDAEYAKRPGLRDERPRPGNSLLVWDAPDIYAETMEDPARRRGRSPRWLTRRHWSWEDAAAEVPQLVDGKFSRPQASWTGCASNRRRPNACAGRRRGPSRLRGPTELGAPSLTGPVMAFYYTKGPPMGRTHL